VGAAVGNVPAALVAVGCVTTGNLVAVAAIGAGTGVEDTVVPAALVAVAPATVVAITVVGIAPGVGVAGTDCAACGLGIGPVDMDRVQPDASTINAATAKNDTTSVNFFIHCLLALRKGIDQWGQSI
jgi:hypothetical protein